MRRLITFVAAAWIAASPAPAGAAGTTVQDQPVSRPLAVVHGAVARSKVADPVPAPTHFMLTGQLAADGRVAIRCDASENPAWRVWRDRVDAGRRTEAR